MLVFWVRSRIPFHLRQRCLWLPHSQSMLYLPGFLQLCISKELLAETLVTPPSIAHLLSLCFSAFPSFPFSPFEHRQNLFRGLSFMCLELKLCNHFALKPVRFTSCNWQQRRLQNPLLFPIFSHLCVKGSWFGDA